MSYIYYNNNINSTNVNHNSTHTFINYILKKKHAEQIGETQLISMMIIIIIFLIIIIYQHIIIIIIILCKNIYGLFLH